MSNRLGLPFVESATGAVTGIIVNWKTEGSKSVNNVFTYFLLILFFCGH